MIVWSSPRLAFVGQRVRQAVLVLAALFIAHDAIYLASFGLGTGYDQAMVERGHASYWVPVSILLTLAVSMVALAVIAGYQRLRGSATRHPALADSPSYPAELASIWLRLFPSVALLFAVQENLEHLAVNGHLVGIAPLLGPGTGYVLPVLAATTFLLAGLGAVVRWQIRRLEARLAAGLPQRFGRVTPAGRPRAWDGVAALIAHRWTLARPIAGRAPPRGLHP